MDLFYNPECLSRHYLLEKLMSLLPRSLLVLAFVVTSANCAEKSTPKLYPADMDYKDIAAEKNGKLFGDGLNDLLNGNFSLVEDAGSLTTTKKVVSKKIQQPQAEKPKLLKEDLWEKSVKILGRLPLDFLSKSEMKIQTAPTTVKEFDKSETKIYTINVSINDSGLNVSIVSPDDSRENISKHEDLLKKKIENA